jgi:hypothetical protein
LDRNLRFWQTAPSTLPDFTGDIALKMVAQE